MHNGCFDQMGSSDPLSSGRVLIQYLTQSVKTLGKPGLPSWAIGAGYKATAQIDLKSIDSTARFSDRNRLAQAVCTLWQ